MLCVGLERLAFGMAHNAFLVALRLSAASAPGLALAFDPGLQALWATATWSFDTVKGDQHILRIRQDDSRAHVR
jgi:hypothetical protein